MKGHSMRSRALTMILVGFVSGCSEEAPVPGKADTVMTTEGYDKGCMANTDCILVFTGDVCGCDCTQEAINAGESTRYAASQEQKRKACVDILACQPCPDTEQAVCDQAICTVVTK